MTTVERAKAFAWDFYVNDVTVDFRKFPSHKLYDMLIEEEYLFCSDIVLNFQFEDMWESSLAPLLKELYSDVLELLNQERNAVLEIVQ